MMQTADYLKHLHMPAARRCYEQLAEKARNDSWGYEQYLQEVVKQECESRMQNRIARNLNNSKLPLSKTLETLDIKRLPVKVSSHLKVLTDGSFLDRNENILVFGNPGSGKTHLICAIAHELILRGKRLFFTSCSQMVQNLLIAKRDLSLVKLLKKLAGYDGVIIDDIGYVQQRREEMEVLFTFLADRYEQGSVMVTSNLPFSKWDKIFKDPMTTAAAIDRLVHHSIVLELNLPSYRLEQSKNRKKE
jgi:DNA replication protein DnaC